MTAYQNLWNAEIETILKELEAPVSLEENIVDTIKNAHRTGIFPNQIINALRLGQSLKEGNNNIALVASMQSGKSGTIYFLCNYVLPALGLIAKYESILFVTSMRDTDLYEQNCRNLEAEYYDCNTGKTCPSNLKVMKMSDFFNHPNPHKVVNEYDVQLIVRDEDQYGCGEESSFQIAFFSELRRRIPDIKLLAVSATPYDIMDAQYSGAADVDVVVGVRPPQYFGISEMLDENLIENLPNGFKPLQTQKLEDGEKIYSLHPKVEEYTRHLMKFDNGIGIVRESNTVRAVELRNLLKDQFKKQCEIIVIGSNSCCDFDINEGIKEVGSLVLKRGKRVVLIIVQALSAGKDLGTLKEYIRFGIETRASQLANGAQGISGRFCGYHKNKDFKLMANKGLLEHYAAFEQDPEVFSDEEWRNELFNHKVHSLSTQTSFVNTQREGVFTPIVNTELIDFNDFDTPESREKLAFLDEEGFQRLCSFFEEPFYNFTSKGTRLKQKGVTVRIASSYNQDSNRVYKNWNCTKEDDFGSVFFKKNQYEYGVLISNYPANDRRNQSGFCGVKIIQSGVRITRNQETSVLNASMYADPQSNE